MMQGGNYLLNALLRAVIVHVM